MAADDVKFCRRVGERSGAPRALIVGFYTEYARNTLLRNAKHLAESEYDNISIVPDLTRQQRAEENSMEEEVARRNEEELTEDDLAKNLCWKVVGQRGDKRMIKGYNRGEAPTRARGRGRGRWQARGTGGTRERGGARGGVWGTRTDSAKRTRASSESDQDLPPPTRARGGARGVTRRASAATGANRVGLGSRLLAQPAAEDSEMEEEREEVTVVVEDRTVEETEGGVRIGVEETEAEKQF
jgi:hypothetical protein